MISPHRVDRTQTALRWFASLSLLLSILLLAFEARAHGTASVNNPPYTAASPEARKIEFPAVAGYKLIVADLHSHSVFSDGHVWPKIRIEEALRDGLDAFAVTEHLEYQPHLADIPNPDRNRATMESRKAAEGSDLIVIAGSEITRQLPVGHINALFVTDANKLFNVSDAPEDPADTIKYYIEANKWDPKKALKAANDQGAFVFINHPNWPAQRPSGLAMLSPFHEEMIGNRMIHGVEIANGPTYSAEAFQLALDHGLTLLGVSDIHDLIDWDFPPHHGEHRPVTLVLAEERTEASIREALFAGRTVVWFRNLLMGRSPQLMRVLDASLEVTAAAYEPKTSVLNVTFANHSDAHFELHAQGDVSFVTQAGRFVVPAHGEKTVMLTLPKRVPSYTLVLEVENALTAPDRRASLSFTMTPAMEDASAD